MPEIRSLACPLTDEDFELRASSLAAALEKKKHLQEAKKRATAESAQAIKDVDAQIEELRATVKARAELRPVEVRWHEDHATGTMRLIRLDTGDEIDSRPMSQDERQVKLFSAPSPLRAVANVEPTGEPKPRKKKSGAQYRRERLAREQGGSDEPEAG